MWNGFSSYKILIVGGDMWSLGLWNVHRSIRNKPPSTEQVCYNEKKQEWDSKLTAGESFEHHVSVKKNLVHGFLLF